MNRLCRICFWTICCSISLAHTASAAEKSSARSLQDSYAAAAEKAFPAVVVIENYRKNGRSFVRVGTGSGFLVRSNGYIATNYHVVKGADSLAVKLADRQPIPAEIVKLTGITDGTIYLDAQLSERDVYIYTCT